GCEEAEMTRVGLRQFAHRSTATLQWLAHRLLLGVLVLLTGWAVYHLVVVPIANDDAWALAFVAAWFVTAYILLPRVQRLLARIYVPDYFVGRTRTHEGLLGDPVNLALMGDEDDLV